MEILVSRCPRISVMHIAHVRTYDIMYEYFPRTDKSFFSSGYSQQRNSQSCLTFEGYVATHILLANPIINQLQHVQVNPCPESLKIFSFFSAYQKEYLYPTIPSINGYSHSSCTLVIHTRVSPLLMDIVNYIPKPVDDHPGTKQCSTSTYSVSTVFVALR